MQWNFPLAIPERVDRNRQMAKKVASELAEFEKETDLQEKAKEAVDVLHSAENLVRKFFKKHPQLSFKKTRIMVIRKNAQRGYYKRRKTK